MYKTAPKKRKGLTLIEMLVVMGIISIVGASIFGVLNAGLKLWSRSLEIENTEDVRIFIDRLSNDLRNVVNFSEIKFYGRSSEIAFASISEGIFQAPWFEDEEAAFLPQIKRIAYDFDVTRNKVIRKESDYSDFSKKDIGSQKDVLRDVLSFKITYFVNDRGDRLKTRNTLEVGMKPEYIQVDVKYKEKTGMTKEIRELIDIPINLQQI